MEKDGLNRVKVSAADAKKWESDFLADVPKMYKRPDSAINEKFFNQVEDMLTKYRSGKK
jgi:hypothetical protein